MPVILPRFFSPALTADLLGALGQGKTPDLPLFFVDFGLLP